MRPDCDCEFCKRNINEFFCSKCHCVFNECETFFEYRDPRLGCAPLDGIVMCPKCHPEDWNPRSRPYVFQVFKAKMKEMKSGLGNEADT